MLRLCVLIVAAIVTAKGQAALYPSHSEARDASIHSVELSRDSSERVVK
jgi:hypothetical protein